MRATDRHVPRTIHRDIRRHAGPFLAVLVAWAVAGAAQAAPLSFTGTLALQVATLPPVAVTGAGVAEVSGDSVSLPGGAFATTGLVVPVTDPAAFPILGVQVTAQNAAGTFASGAGPMPLIGAAKVCLFGECSALPVSNLTVPISVVGGSGTATITAAVNLTVLGAPWTTGTVSVGTLTAMGGTTGGGAVAGGTLHLVTPVLVSTNIGSFTLVPIFGSLALSFVPEPGTLLLLGSGLGALALAGRARRRGSA